MSVFPLLLKKNKQASNTVQFPNLINVLNGDPARVGIAVGSGVDGASWVEISILASFSGGDPRSVKPGQAPALGLLGLELILRPQVDFSPIPKKTDQQCKLTFP